ncbi:hypothetical protein [Nodosilinea sp. E11]|uniref:hypothetical protein n=1 Tax=Nodosilinea sp. E11 TaxID=3037479 RepID=UPI002934645E|nr:hypothetical protein [Nodosilinea sp. E11]WOD40807.1 hypothetical protein RRF56_08370 [Nodosilinea sp. E11]
MKTVSLLDVLAPLAELLEQAQEEALILQTPDGKEFVLAALNNFAHEVELTRQNPALMALLDRHGQEESTVKLLSLKAQLGLDC